MCLLIPKVHMTLRLKINKNYKNLNKRDITKTFHWIVIYLIESLYSDSNDYKKVVSHGSRNNRIHTKNNKALKKKMG